MSILNYFPKKIPFLLAGVIILSFLNSCGIYKPVDARKVSPSSQERVKKNLEEGKGWSIKKLQTGGSRGTSYQFATSNKMQVALGKHLALKGCPAREGKTPKDPHHRQTPWNDPTTTATRSSATTATPT